ncbi:TIGR04211 family SH3 domain-containing protein [Mangrovimicrobium sediminis]|uniref:TIGR04211 family SH3 domain-containing protein n=1 Tax=Mangrovimicrobium sediminis TaxID=2562682 RepID=A0A4Z0M1H2_9GAMM|nr:TIGR04211 family SH3 domain-containing protein [Haliea sp. SAOS-164]TGD73452.1 TIGR04211 family SH3 domain-containing protein [Haliea sp. SAOS-164]
MRRFLLPCLILLCALPATARETRYVSDEVFIVLHSGPGNQYRWLGKLTPGTRMELGQTAEDGEWAEVTTSAGTTGWVKTEFLTPAPTAQVKLARAESRASQLETQNRELSAQLQALQTEKAQLNTQLGDSTGELDEVSTQLANLQQISGNAVQLDTDNRRLVEQNENLRSEVEMLEAENQRLTDNLQSEDFLNGAMAVLLGVIITLVVPRLWPKRRRMSEWA